MKRFFGISLSLVILLSSFFFCGFSGQAYASEQTRYSRGGVAYQDITEKIYYDYCVVDQYFNTREIASYQSDGVGVCAVTAGGAALGYYDWVYEDLIPNHGKYVLWGYEFYGSQGAGVDAMFSSLYSRMGTTSSGTTVAGYLSGMDSYVRDHGYTIEQTSAMSNGSLNMAAYKAALRSDKLMAVFFSGFAVIPFAGLVTYNGYDRVDHAIFTGNHAMMAYGYMHIKYYNLNHQLVRELQLLLVNSSIHNPVLCYVNVAQYGTVNDAYVTYIY